MSPEMLGFTVIIIQTICAMRRARSVPKAVMRWLFHWRKLKKRRPENKAL